MTQRNLIREGFVFNTRTPAGTISGSQIVSPGEINSLVDEDVSSTAFTISGTKFTVLDADLGARWKLNKIQLYTAETTASNFTMQISDNNLDFRTITMTGSTGLWVGDIPTTVASGSPRYIRYKHSPAINTVVREWTAINDETFVDFGSDGSQTSLFIDDAPIGRASEIVETLSIKNNFTKSAEGFVFVDRTFNDAEDELEISISPQGPWVGRNTNQANQPQIVPWQKGVLFNSRVVPSGLGIFSFTNGLANGWNTTGATQTFIGGALRGTTTTQTPLTYISSEFSPFVSSETYTASLTRHTNKFVLQAKDATSVRVRARVSTPLSVSNLLSGPRLFWKTEQNVEATPDAFRSALSVQSKVGNSPFTGQVQEFTFPVSTVPTWSGSIRGFAFQPFVVATGTNIIYDFFDLEVFNPSGDKIVLDFNPVSSGSFPSPFSLDEATMDTTSLVAVSVRHRITQDCIITKVKAMINKNGSANSTGVFLARRLSGSVFPSPGTNFTCPYAVAFFDTGISSFDSTLEEVSVFWQAQRGDFIALAQQNTAGSQGFRYTTGVSGDAFVSTTISGFNIGLTSLTNFTNILNQNSFSAVNRNYLVSYDALPTEQGGYKSTGTYRTPVFDIGQSPSLADLDFDSTTTAGTSIDTLGQSGFDSVKARANDIPARTGLRLGETGLTNGTSPTLAMFVNQTVSYNKTPSHDQQINCNNSTLSAATATFVQNVAASVLYHTTNNELWLLDTVFSGTNPFLNTDVRPTWDVLNPETGDYLRTDHLKGSFTYGYDGTKAPFGTSAGNNQVRNFAPIGMVADYVRGEIYIIQKLPAFTIGAGNYYGLIMDLNGNFKDVFWRSGSMGFDSTINIVVETQMIQARGLTYAENLKDLSVVDPNATGVFFLLHDFTLTGNSATTIHPGTYITALRNGNDSGLRNIGAINSKPLSTISGLGFIASGNSTPKGLVYNQETGLIYLLFDNLTGSDLASNRKPEFLTIRPSFNTFTSQFDYTLTTVSGTAFNTGIPVDGWSRRPANLPGGFTALEGQDNNWEGLDPRSHDFTMGVTYSNLRDSFVILRSYFGRRATSFPAGGAVSVTGDFDVRSYSFIFECGAGSRTSINNPAIPSALDAIWGTLSGTLSFQDIATQGVNFPTGRYAQVEYQLNSNGTQTATLELINSNIASGLRVGTIPPGGTKEISVRTNIPEGKEIGDQQGRLKVFLESEE